MLPGPIQARLRSGTLATAGPCATLPDSSAASAGRPLPQSKEVLVNIDNELADRLDDLAEERAGNVHAEVVGHLNAAWEHLFDYQSGAACCDPLTKVARNTGSEGVHSTGR